MRKAAINPQANKQIIVNSIDRRASRVVGKEVNFISFVAKKAERQKPKYPWMNERMKVLKRILLAKNSKIFFKSGDLFLHFLKSK